MIPQKTYAVEVESCGAIRSEADWHRLRTEKDFKEIGM